MGQVQSTHSSAERLRGMPAGYGEGEKLALLGLWSVAGVGPRTLAELRAWAGGSLEPLLRMDVSEYANGAQVQLTVPVRERLMQVRSLEQAAQDVLRRAEQSLQKIRFIHEPGYPELLAKIADAPPVLFVWGELGPMRKRVALVGSRKPSNHFTQHAQGFAEEIARAGVGVVSGGAYGVDQACHQGAIAVGGETWAFVGSSLDQLDPVPWSQVTKILKARGMVMTEYPPGVRADRNTFRRRNRLISGASDVTVVLRAAGESGALSTAEHAMKQRRPLFAMPGEVHEPTAQGCNQLIARGYATAVTSPEQILAALKVTRGAQPAPVGSSAERMAKLSVQARAVYAALERVPQDLESIAAKVSLSSGALTAALVELELNGLCQQYPGKVYEKV